MTEEEDRAIQYRKDHRAWRLAEIARLRGMRGSRSDAIRLRGRVWPLVSGQAVPLITEQRPLQKDWVDGC